MLDPQKKGIGYAPGFSILAQLLWNTGSPASAGDDGRGARPGWSTWLAPSIAAFPSRLLQELRPQHEALDLVGAAFDLVFIVGEMDVPDHGAALEHGGRALQLEVLDQRDAVALGEQRAVGIPDLDVHGVSSSFERYERALLPS